MPNVDLCAKHGRELARILKSHNKQRAVANSKSPGKGYKHDWQKIRDALMAATNKGKTTTGAAVARQLKIHNTAVQSVAKELIKAGRLKSTGTGAGRKLSRP